MSNFFKRGFLLFTYAAIISCATPRSNIPSVKLFIDSYGDETKLSGKRYILLPYDSLIYSNYLLFEELSQYVNLQFKLKEYVLVYEIDSADCIVFLNYGTSDPQRFEQEIYKPIYGKTGYSSSTITGTAQLKYYPDLTNISYSQQTTYTPTYGVIGTQTKKITTTYYSHYMVLSLFEKNSMVDNFNKSLRWKLITKLDSESSDLRMKFAQLVAGSRKYIGKNSYMQVHEFLSLDDPNLAWLIANSDNAFSAYEKEKGQSKSFEMQPSIPLTEDEILLKKYKAQRTVDSKKYNSMDEVHRGDVVVFYSPYGDAIYGIVDSNSKNKIIIKTYPTPSQKIIETVSWKLVLKVSAPN